MILLIDITSYGHQPGIMLPNPALGDEDIYDTKMRYRLAMNTNAYTFVSNPTKRKFRFNLDKLTRSKLYELFNYISQAAGHRMLLLHHSGTSYRGYLLTTTISTNTTGRFMGDIPTTPYYNEVISNTLLEFQVQ